MPWPANITPMISSPMNATGTTMLTPNTVSRSPSAPTVTERTRGTVITRVSSSRFRPRAATRASRIASRMTPCTAISTRLSCRAGTNRS